MSEKFIGDQEREEHTGERDAERVDKKESEEDKALRGLKTDILSTAESNEINREKGEVTREQKEAYVDTHNEIGDLKRQIKVEHKNPLKINNYENMNEEEIYAAAEVGRQNSISNVQQMITATKRIPTWFREKI